MLENVFNVILLVKNVLEEIKKPTVFPAKTPKNIIPPIQLVLKSVLITGITFQIPMSAASARETV
jgi:hypothetical protein